MSGRINDPKRIDHTIGLLWDTCAEARLMCGQEAIFWHAVPRCMKPVLAERLVSTLNVLSIAVGKMADSADSHLRCEGFHQ